MKVYYNEFEPYAADWLENLIAAGHLPAGDVDRRDIQEVGPDDLKGYDQCHFFAGIGGWPLALALAGWQGPVWTGSCPCQPLSSAGQQKGHADERHLWPAFYALIAERRPATIFGEQVASALGREWLAGVRADLEGVEYALGAADLCAAGAGAPHIRQRLFWVADAHVRHAGAEGLQRGGQYGQLAPNGSVVGRLGDAPGGRRQGDQRRTGPGEQPEPAGPGFWRDFDLIPCADGKARRVEPGTFPLAHGIPNRVGQLRAYGNAITPQLGAEFVTAYLETRSHDA